MAFLEQGNVKTLKGANFQVKFDVEVTPALPVDIQLTGAGDTRERGTTIYARDLAAEGTLTVRPQGSAQFPNDVQVYVTIDARPREGQPAQVELPRYQVGGLSEFTPLTFSVTGMGLNVAAGAVEKLAEGEDQAYAEIRRSLEETAEAEPANLAPLRVLVYVDQSSSMGYPEYQEKLVDASHFLAQVLSQSRISLDVTGSSSNARFTHVNSSKEAAEAMQALTAGNEIGWPNSLRDALNRYDRAVVITDGMPAEAGDERVFLFFLRESSRRFTGLAFTDHLHRAVQNKDQVELSNMADFVTSQLFGEGE